ncbi:hypothetical protein EJ08DRAFT_59596 [Tothia fuscella]|uniref:Uncharacterized protein n=1 Tax=Tothia fuscella TaxID=1048955 RepID=A0A9P4NWE4_9PEZI|nr:hypothetical protein EJ08DRAFT_59596 [Tothia fuscella]
MRSAMAANQAERRTSNNTRSQASAAGINKHTGTDASRNQPIPITGDPWTRFRHPAKKSVRFSPRGREIGSSHRISREVTPFAVTEEGSVDLTSGNGSNMNSYKSGPQEPPELNGRASVISRPYNQHLHKLIEEALEDARAEIDPARAFEGDGEVDMDVEDGSEEEDLEIYEGVESSGNVEEGTRLEEFEKQIFRASHSLSYEKEPRKAFQVQHSVLDFVGKGGKGMSSKEMKEGEVV